MSVLPPTPQKRPRIFYGWYVLGLASVAGMFAGGTAQAVFGIFVRPIEDETGWSRTAIAGAATVATVVSGVLSFAAGRLTDKTGPRILMTAGVAIYGLAFLSMTVITHIWQFYLAYFVARVSSLHLMAGVVPRTVTVNWFRRMRGRALGLQTTSGPLGGSILAAIAGALLAAGMEWRTVLASIGVAAMALLLVPLPLVIRRQPEDMGLLPDGDVTPPPAPSTEPREPDRRASRKPTGPEVSWTLRQALATKALLLIMVGTLFNSMASGAVSFQLAPYYGDLGLGTGIGAAAASVFLFSGAASASVWGFLAERYDERVLVVIAALAATLLTIYGRFITEPVGALFFAAMYGATTRGEGTLVMMMLAGYYGRRWFGSISGFAGTFSFIGLGLGPLISSRMIDVSGGYGGVFTTATVALGVSAVLLWLAKRPAPAQRQD